MANDTTRLLGLDGLVAERVELDAAGVPVVDLSTGSVQARCCPSAGRGSLGQAVHRQGHPGTTQRLLFVAAGKDLSTCESCLTCPMFMTTAEFLPQHRRHHQEVLQIISVAKARGHARQVEMNRQVADDLEKILASLEGDEPHQPEAAVDAS